MESLHTEEVTCGLMNVNAKKMGAESHPQADIFLMRDYMDTATEVYDSKRTGLFSLISKFGGQEYFRDDYGHIILLMEVL